MPILKRSLLWRRLDTTGTEHVLLTERGGLHARGTVLAADPLPYTCTYELLADDGWVTARLTVTTEGAGWLRSLKLQRALGHWHVSAGEQGDLDAALLGCGQPRCELAGIEEPHRLVEARDVDMAYSALTNTLPLRRLSMVDDRPGTSHKVTVAWIMMPSLQVIPARHLYTTLGEGRVRYESGTFAADLTVDADGYIRRYPGLAELI